MSDLSKYITLAKELQMVNAIIISPEDIHFDIRSILKCRWGCHDFFKGSVKCHGRNTTFSERLEIINRYKHILMVHSHDARELSAALLKLESAAFLDGYYFASAICFCSLCDPCHVENGKPCPTPGKVRPCDELFGIDVYKTARGLGLPCQVLQSHSDTQNRYGFLLID